jgi:anti-sigma factor RsiW
MPEDHVHKDPGHLDIDAVSAYVDQELRADDLAMIAFHLSNCPACNREVHEIRTTVFLLASLPQYEPRRSFCLGQEHARAARRREQTREAQSWSGANALTGQPGVPPALPAAASRGGGWISGLHVAAMVVGTLLLLVTAGDLTGFIDDPSSPMQLAAPTAAAGLPTPPQAAMPAPEAPQAVQEAPPPVADAVSESAPSSVVSAFQEAPAELRGTTDRDSASEEMLEAENLAQSAPRLRATVVGAAAVTQAIPTPGAESASAPSTGGTTENVTDSERAVSEEQPSRMRIVQLALGLLLAWLIVSIAGMRWVRRLR